MTRLGDLRALFNPYNLDGYLVPRTDEHQSEYVADYAERLAWLTGFTGSAGLAVILKDKVGLFVDGRYTLQASREVDTTQIDVVPLADMSPVEWLKAQGIKRLGYHPWLMTKNQLASYQPLDCISIQENFVDAIWKDQPTRSLNKVVIHPETYAGQSYFAKLKNIVADLKKRSVDAVILSKLDSIAWALNLRGHDIEYHPVFYAYLIVQSTGEVTLYLDQEKVTSDVEQHLGQKVTLHSYDSFNENLKSLQGKTVQIDQGSSSLAIVERLEAEGAHIVFDRDPFDVLKACKNQVEISGATAAHIRDGVAVTKFLHWLEKTLEKGETTELAASQKVLDYRKQQALFQQPSFETISGYKSNGAVVHYRVTSESSKTIRAEGMYLVDSGGQYLDGTTDVTRTIALGKPTAEQKDRFTRVLKGHIALARVKFPKGTTGAQLDILARQSLWEIGCDYGHGTGHGVGSYLNVHEGPQNISSRGFFPLHEGMILSNEPGYYQKGEYGIRIENLMVVQSQPLAQEMLAFETITLVPIDKNLIDIALMGPEEIQWLNSYHQRVRETLNPLLDLSEQKWLRQKTHPMS